MLKRGTGAHPSREKRWRSGSWMKTWFSFVILTTGNMFSLSDTRKHTPCLKIQASNLYFTVDSQNSNRKAAQRGGRWLVQHSHSQCLSVNNVKDKKINKSFMCSASEHLCSPGLESLHFTFWDSLTQPHFYISPRLSSDSLHVGPLHQQVSGEGKAFTSCLSMWSRHQATRQKVNSKPPVPHLHSYSCFNQPNNQIQNMTHRTGWR